MKKSTSLVFTGDIGFDKYMDRKWEDDELIAPELLAFLHSGDHVVANIEGPLLKMNNHFENEGVKQLLHAMDPAATSFLDKIHADIWNLCNNHIMDAQEIGVAETLKQAKKHQALTIGAGMNLDEAKKPIILNEAGGIGMFSIGYRRGCKPADTNKAGCFLWHEMDLIQATITEIKKTCKWCVVVVHGGEEFTSLPSPYTRKRYLEYLAMGADIIVSHHPHVPMNYEKIDDKIIFYSLGNFIFDTDYQRSQFNTDIGILLKINFTEDNYTWDACGLKINRHNQHLSSCELPDIFVNVDEREYQLLAPLAAEMMISAYKRQLIYLRPDEFKNASDEQFKANFYEEKRSGRVIGEGLDFQIIYPLALSAKQGLWKQSKLEKVKKYIIEQI